MRKITILSLTLGALLSTGCQQANATGEVAMRTVDNTTVNTMQVEPPPMITEQATELRPAEVLGPDGKPITRATPTPDPAAAEQPQIQMPFAPLIAMDPVDGSKVSIRVGTPVAEYKDRLYYFGSPANKAAFLANPETYAKGSLSRY